MGHAKFFEVRFPEYHVLVRRALAQQAMETATKRKPHASYVSGRLLFTKAALAQQLQKSAGDTAKVSVAASGPVVGLLATTGGVDREVVWIGPDSIHVRLRMEGELQDKDVWKTLAHSTRPFAKSAVDAKQAAKVATAAKDPRTELLGWASAFRLDPKPEYEERVKQLQAKLDADKGQVP